MADKGYNGWTNYETWNVKLWMDNDAGSSDYWMERAQEAYDQASSEKNFTREENAAIWLKHLLKEEIEASAQDMLDAAKQSCSMFADLLNGALSEVDWLEIAESYMSDVEKEVEA